jgi:hypothetical protein
LFVKSFCRVENSEGKVDRFCVECCACSGHPCCLVGELKDGTIGCQGHESQIGLSTLPQREICKCLDCLSGCSDEDKEKILKKISQLPVGQFKMCKVLKCLY